VATPLTGNKATNLFLSTGTDTSFPFAINVLP
jgi:hypothetical protein